MFDYHNIDLAGKNIVLINRSNLVGKPLYHLLLEKNATVITCHSKTKDIEKFCKSADIIITAVGDRTKFILTPEMIKESAIVIDVAISRFEDKLVGDCDYEKIIEKASFATPVPGGVGPMTVAMLLKIQLLPHHSEFKLEDNKKESLRNLLLERRDNTSFDLLKLQVKKYKKE